jgi:WD40 repeat protein
MHQMTAAPHSGLSPFPAVNTRQDKKMAHILQFNVIVVGLTVTAPLAAAEPPDFNADVLPVFRKYCLGCHNAKVAEGGLVLEDHARTLNGGDEGAVLVAGKSAESRLWQVVAGKSDPKMPPEDSPQPKPEELAVIRAWIDAGAKPPAKGIAGLVTPKIAPKGTVRQPITSLAVDPQGRWLAVARPAAVEILSQPDRQLIQELTGHTGPIADVQVSADGHRLIVAAGEIGLAGEATLWNTADWTRGPVITGHRDALYSAALSPDGKTLATASYDKEIHAWNITKHLPSEDREAPGSTSAASERGHQGADVSRSEIPSPIASMLGHNDAVFSLAFHPVRGHILASASGDRTVKLWDVATGQRLDTFSQPSKEQNSVVFSPDGRLVAAGGSDNRIRVWSVSETGKEGTNPILYARFAHEGPILKVAFSPDGRLLASSSQDLRIKIWETHSFTQVAVFDRQPDWAAALAFSPDSRTLFVGRMDGSLGAYEMKPAWGDRPGELERLSTVAPANGAFSRPLSELTEAEPNDELTQAQDVAWPATVSGRLAGTPEKPGGDVDLFQLKARAGETWMLETNAARSGSPADTKIDILHADGSPVLRGLLQAVRDSWINFRPIDSTSAEVRLEYWEEMDINQYLYMNGEVTKLFRAPRGPDSGWALYSNQGQRICYFDTSAAGQAKDQPVYIVEAYPAGSSIVDNGLPVFPLYYLNDDDGERELGNDSRLTFTAPADGTYLIRVRDSRGFSGDSFTYRLTVRPPKPDFTVRVDAQNLKVPAGSGQRLSFSLDRIDNFDGEVRLDIANVPAGYQVASPAVFQAGHLKATSVITADADAQPVPKERWEQVQITATAVVGGQTVTKLVGHLGEITREPPPKIRVTLQPDNPADTAEDGGLVIAPGTTVTALLKVERNGYDGDVRFDVDGLPHGVIVDNIGLSGILVRANETQRQIFLTARPWVPPTTHLIDAVAQTEGNQASRAIALHVR